jgi:hypothetical protein
MYTWTKFFCLNWLSRERAVLHTAVSPAALSPSLLPVFSSSAYSQPHYLFSELPATVRKYCLFFNFVSHFQYFLFSQSLPQSLLPVLESALYRQTAWSLILPATILLGCYLILLPGSVLQSACNLPNWLFFNSACFLCSVEKMFRKC